MTWVLVYLMFLGGQSVEITARVADKSLCRAMQDLIEAGRTDPKITYKIVRGCTPEVKA